MSSRYLTVVHSNVLMPSLHSLAVPLGACGVYWLLDSLPEGWVRRLATSCGATSSHALSLKGLLHSGGVGLAALLVLLRESELQVSEPQRSFSCLPAPSLLHSLLPQVELGYAMYDAVSALRLWNWTFVLHGIVASAVLLIVSSIGVAHHLSRVLVIHLSTVFLHLRRVSFSPRVNRRIDFCFGASFCILRLILLPWWWINFLAHAYYTPSSSWGECMSGGVIVACVLGGLVLHSLNAYWGLLILGKLRDKLRGHDLRGHDGLGKDAIESDFKKS